MTEERVGRTTKEKNSQLMLLALSLSSKTVYVGTVGAKEKSRRRAANKVARASRRRNRG